MIPKVYMRIQSPPCRAVLMVSKALGVKLETVNLSFEDNLSPEFIKKNPQHTIPTLEDDGKIIWDSHAINIYLVSKYGRDDSLYPNDPYKRAVINQRLHFNSGMLQPTGKQLRNAIVVNKLETLPAEYINGLEETYGFLEKFLEGHQWVAGDDLTLADFSLIPTVTSFKQRIPFDENKFPSIVAWIKRAETWPFYDINREGLAVQQKFFDSFLKK